MKSDYDVVVEGKEIRGFTGGDALIYHHCGGASETGR